MTLTTLTTLRRTVSVAGLAAGLLCTMFAATASAQDATSAATASAQDATSAPSASAQDPEAVGRGRAKYTHTCAPCHGRGLGDDGREALPGTAALEIKYRGALPAVLEDRTGLSYEVLKPFVRNGSWSMPPFRPTELTDNEIRDIAAYLAVSSREASSRASSPSAQP